MKYNITEISQLDRFTQDFSQKLNAGDVVYLCGDLGAGKTTFTQLLLKNLGYMNRVKSPTYAIYETYDLKNFQVIHMDLYRIGDPQELYYLALDEIFNGDKVVIIEWPENGSGVIPGASYRLTFDLVNAKNRELILDIT
ncbi:MAG: tRNA (adenosine(37)-N6)-threonylcarbamoyltransferase complex ATPase subunit type 1 TsaE [Marinicellaceae bacterium]